MSRVKGAKNVYQGWLYDTNTVPAATATTELLYFVVPRGQAGKSASDTNLDVGGQLTGVNAFQIRSWVLKMEDLTLTANAKLVQTGNFTLVINSTPIPDPIPNEFILGGAALLESVRGPAAAPEFRSIGGPGNITNVLSFTRPFLVTLDPGDTFSVSVQFPGSVTLTESCRLRVILWGRRAKPVM
ncbi:MAG TPA: hypothetical protein VFG76_11525 [Candidatus Polarisedimenticolia bacterium]|jgi:hypothetical protein|nr:hypothetical protein [Candidatus Polarisedimenticolia bacterium]